jgi:hypothetical protein
VATESRPALPDDLPGVPGPLIHVVDVVSGEAPVGDRVLVVDQDGHLRGSGVADLLAGQGRRVRIATEQLYVGQGIDLKTLLPLQRRLREQGVEMMPSTRFAGWDGGRPVVADVFTRAERTLGDVDTVVWPTRSPARCSGPSLARHELLEQRVPRVAPMDPEGIGDAHSVPRVQAPAPGFRFTDVFEGQRLRGADEPPPGDSAPKHHRVVVGRVRRAGSHRCPGAARRAPRARSPRGLLGPRPPRESRPPRRRHPAWPRPRCRRAG